MKHILLVAFAAAVFVVGAAAVTPDPKAFQRPARAEDRYSGLLHRSWEISDSRLVARLVVRRPNRINTARLYLVRREDRLLCLILRDGAGDAASCASSPGFAKVFLISGRLLAGVAANDVARVVAVGTRGVRYRLQLTRDQGFIWDCRAWNGCRSVIAAIEAYNGAGKLVYRANW